MPERGKLGGKLVYQPHLQRPLLTSFVVVPSLMRGGCSVQHTVAQGDIIDNKMM